MQVPAQTGSQLAQQRPGGLPYKWIVAIVIIFGIFMSILDTTIVNVAIPRLQSAFGAGLTSVQWVATAYTLAQGVTTPLTPFFSQRIGIKRLYIVAITSFIIGSALCGLAWSLPVLILFRILQAVGGAFLFPLSITMLYSEFPPEERGTAIGTLGIPILIAPALGPTVGGFIVTYLGWQLIFYINVPIGIVGIILAMLLLREAPLEQQRRRFDIPGFVFSAIGLSALLYGLSDAGTDGWRSDIVLGCIALGVLSLAIFTVIELMIARSGGQPLLDLRVFGNGPFASSTIASVFVTFALYGGLFLVPIYLQDLRGLSAYQAGLILLPQALGSMVATLVRFVASSLGIAILSTTVQTQTQVHYSHLAERVTPASPLGMLIPRLEALFVASGASVTAAAQAATQLVIQLLQLQAFMLGIEDAFLLTLVFAIIAFIAIFFVRGGRQRGGRAAPQTPAPQEEERGGRVEATLPR